MPRDHERRSKLNQESLLQRIAHAVMVGINGELCHLLRPLGGCVARYRGGKQRNDKKEGSGAPEGSHLCLSASDLLETVYARAG